jgi:hypothetical protein
VVEITYHVRDNSVSGETKFGGLDSMKDEVSSEIRIDISLHLDTFCVAHYQHHNKIIVNYDIDIEM